MKAREKIAIIDQKGGSGHEKAADKIQADCQNAGVPFVRINTTEDDDGWMNLKHLAEDVYLNYVPFINQYLEYNLGAEGVSTWNTAQKTGNTRLQKQIIKQQFLANIIFSRSFYQHTTRILTQHPDLDQIVSTQQMCVASILRAIADWNQSNNKQVSLKIIMTDLPTTSASHFFDSFVMIRLDDLNHAQLNLQIPFPAVTMDIPCLADYHAEFAKLCPKFYVEGTTRPRPNIHITFTNGPIDQCFLNIKKEIDEKGALAVKKHYKSMPVPFKFSETAYKCVKTLSQLKNMNFVEQLHEGNSLTNHVELNIPENAWVEYILLGSQVSEHGAIGLTKLTFELYQKHHKPRNIPFYLFVLCNNNEELLKKITQLAEYYYQQDTFYIIPLSNQAPQTIARLGCIADTPMIRSGGMSEMEVEAVATGTVVHYAEIDPSFEVTELINNPKLTLVGWELGNVEHAETTLGQDRVIVVNLENYLTKRLADLATREYYADKLECVDQELITIRDKYFTNKFEDKKDEVIKTAAAFYLKSMGDFDGDQSFLLDDANLYGQLYYEGLSLFSEYAPATLQNKRERRHPNGWVIRYLNYLFDHVKIQRSDNPINELQNHKDKSVSYANLFYDPAAPIFDEKEALTLLNPNKFSDLDEFDEFVHVSSTEEYKKGPIHQKIEWDLLNCFNVRDEILNQLKNYAPQGFLTQTVHLVRHPMRTQQSTAKKFIAKLEEDINSDPLNLLMHFQEFHQECNNDPKMNKKGEFYILINSIYHGLVSLVRENMQPTNERLLVI